MCFSDVGNVAKSVGSGILMGPAGAVAGLKGLMPSPPPAPDYMGAANAQTQTNRPNQNSPFASSGWTLGPNGQWTQSTQLDPSLQGAAGGFAAQLGNSADPAARQHVEDALFARAKARLDPMFQQQGDALNTRLANQGLDPMSEAATNANANFGRTRNDAYSSALNDAITGGGVEQARQQSLAMGGLQGLQGLTAQPGFQPGGNSLAAAIAAGQYGMDAANLSQQQWADILGALGKAGGAAAGRG